MTSLRSKSLITMLVFCWYLLPSCVGFVKTDSNMRQAIGAFAAAHSVNCHTLLFTYSNEFYEQKKLFDFHRAIINDNFIPTALENINDPKRNYDELARVRCSRTLRSFIMGNVTYILEYMVASSRIEDIRKDQWLIFIGNETDVESITSRMELSIRSEVYVAREAANGFEVLEVYQPAKNNRILINHYGDWNAETGLSIQQLSVLQRRNDFGGAVFRAAKTESQRHESSLMTPFGNVLGKVWILLEKELNFTTKYTVVPNHGSKYDPHKHPFNIITKMLANNEVDVSLARFSLKTDDSYNIDYSVPLLNTNSKIWIKASNRPLESWWHMLHPFSIEGWCCVVLTTTAIPVVTFLMFAVLRRTGFMKTEYNFSDLCVLVHQLLCAQGGDLQQAPCSIKLVFVSFNLGAFLIRTMYSAALASSLAIKLDDLPFSTLTGLLENGQYEFGVHRYSRAFDIYYEKEDPFITRLNKATMDKNISNLPTTYLEGLIRVCSKKNYAFMANEAVVSDLKSRIPCELVFLKNEMPKIGVAYAMSKRNVYLPFINRWLHLFNQFGLMSKFKREVVGNDLHSINDQVLFKNLNWEDTVLLHCLLSVGALLSVLILCIEIIYYKWRGEVRQRTVVHTNVANTSVSKTRLMFLE